MAGWCEEGRKDIYERAFDFAVRIVKFTNIIRAESRTIGPIADQLLRSGTSVGANL